MSEPAKASSPPKPSAAEERRARMLAAMDDCPTAPSSGPVPERKGGPRRRPEKVILWDLDDTLIVWDSMSKGAFDMPDGVCDELWEGWFALSKQFQEECLHGSLVKEAQSEGAVSGTEVLYSLMSAAPNGAVANAYVDIQNKFAAGAIPSSMSIKQGRLYKRLDKETGGWLTTGKETLGMCHQQEGTLNVLVTASRLQAAVGKLMLFGLNDCIHADCIYSCWMRGTKKDAFRKLTAKYSSARFVAVGDGKQEKQASEELKIPFFQIRNLADLKKARTNLER